MKVAKGQLPPGLKSKIDAAVQRSLHHDGLKGAVVAVVWASRLAYVGAYGLRQLKPKRAPMSRDTVFDIASLTKPIATATLIMQLVEAKRLKLSDPVAKFLPDFGVRGKSQVTIEQLLRHSSGLPGATHLKYYRLGREQALQSIYRLKLRSQPGRKVAYSDVGYLLLAEIASAVTKTDFAKLVSERVLKPLAMKDTGFSPGPWPLPRLAPTERTPNGWLQGTVHDPRARLLGGAAGHAGLFATAADVARYLLMLCHGGRAGKTRVLQQRSIALLASPGAKKRTLAFQQRNGGLWHTGFTGTALWVAPARGRGLVILTSRLYPDGKAKVGNLRFVLRQLVAQARHPAPAPK